MIKNNFRGFTLIELLIVVAILGIIMAMAIPNLLRARMTANEVNAIGALKTLAVAQTDYNTNCLPHSYTGSLENLGSGAGAGNVPFIDPALSSGIKSGYTFRLTISDTPTNDGSYWCWSGTAWPIVHKSTGSRTFYIDETGVIRGKNIDGVSGDLSLPELE